MKTHTYTLDWHFLTLFDKVSVWALILFFLCQFGSFHLHFSFCTSPRVYVSTHIPTTVWALKESVWTPAPSWHKQLRNHTGQKYYSLNGQNL